MSTSIGTSDRPASTTAGWKFAAAVPLVHSSSAGAPVEPEAEGDERRRPLVVDHVHRQIVATSAIASAIGVLREPGRDDGVGTPRADPLVDQRGAERRLHARRRARSESSPPDDTGLGWRHGG